MDLSGYEAVRLLLLLSLLWEPAAPRCAVSLGYDFTVRTNGQPWCDIEGRVNGNTFLHYTCGGQLTLTSVPDMNATRAWGEQRDTLQSVVEELRVPLLDMRAEIPAAGGPLALQGTMACQRESSGHTSASWQFGSNGQPSLRFDSTNKHWTVLRGEGMRLKTALAGDRTMTHLLVMTSNGDCAVSLRYDFTIRPNGQLWCDIEGRVNGNTFLHFTCGGQLTLTSVPDMNATRAWGEQRDTLQSVVEELRMLLLDMRAEIPAAGGPLALQGSMACERESSGRTSASWQFGSDGQPSLRFDSTNGHWTVLRGEGRRLKTALAGDGTMTHLLVMTSTGDCTQWLQQVLCPLSTQAASATATATATATVSSKVTANRPVSWVLPGMLTCAITDGLLDWAFA